MQKREKINRTRKLTVRFTETEYKKLELSYKTTTKQKISEYVRDVLLDRPVTVYTRSQSLDEIIVCLRQLKAELSFIGNNFNQAVKKLHTTARDAEIIQWAQRYETDKELFMKKTNEINNKIGEIAGVWLHG